MKLCGGTRGVMLGGWGWGLRGEGWCTMCPSHAEDCFCLSYGPSLLPTLLSSLLPANCQLSAHVGSLLVSWFPLSSCYTLIAVTRFTSPHWGTPVSVIPQVCVCPRTPSSSVTQVPLYVELYLPGLPWGRTSSRVFSLRL